ncbi:hypothetical protein [Pseudobacteriovorax antillogorgiicola]|uniref:Uncharacterized protein n=1 Tax=Pseudobacteriovorax antillogorgiicola TaxID=1513793 RepID=A0A1Y6B682_9BACT|nr:hypothetical protein [Pseudobacteriovorax antillogorgiicola]TCS58822.1 hypothetical protein EDD56_102337 [Pseudobacteriovorax antillogorgiicola]SME94260.1 hypothetical protein SAMN06296036_102106 [Pseudobacteriovorax antillogorgiicola]
MGKVINLTPKKTAQDRMAEKMVEIAEEIDAVILKHLQDDNIDPRDLVGLLSHRLGTLMNHLDEKSELWFICERVMKRQAQIPD